jgi:hypothetical protein
MEFYKLRTAFPQKGCVWHYQGSLRNPANGKIIAGVEGIEFIQNSNNLNITEKQSSRPLTLYLTKKLFFHVDAVNHSHLLTTFKHSPISVAKSVRPMKTSIELITLNQHESTPQHDNKNSSNYRSVIHFSPFRKIFSQKLEFISGQSILSSLGGIKLNHIVTPQDPVETNEKKNSWKKWISFGPGSGNSPLSRSTELYHIYPTTSRSSSSFWSSFFGRFFGSSSAQVALDYQRFGEGPEWFLPGRPVITEMKGIRYARLEDIPGSIVSLLKQVNQSNMLRGCGALEEEFRNPSSDSFLQYSPWYSVLSTYWHKLKLKPKNGEKLGG